MRCQETRGGWAPYCMAKCGVRLFCLREHVFVLVLYISSSSNHHNIPHISSTSPQRVYLHTFGIFPLPKIESTTEQKATLIRHSSHTWFGQGRRQKAEVKGQKEAVGRGQLAWATLTRRAHPSLSTTFSTGHGTSSVLKDSR